MVIHTRDSKYYRNMDIVYIGRPSKWGNPFVLGQDGNREEVIAKYKAYVLNSPNLLKDLGELQNKKLACFCKPLACHGDVLEQLSNVKGELK